MHFDEDGYLFDPSQWTPELAHEIAILDGIGPLIKEHFLIIDYVREHYLRFGAMPLMRRVCRANNLHKHAVKKLFGSCRTMWRVAGLPNPGEEAKTYMV
ncbi:MAG: TusE/DsrC/DsvC family sulfur relay protein [Gammaproteobacteria bacterium]|nr:TusE/DsrC/DsvC family sulfur relay protein [Gammaproteobacteria bacterium]